MLVLLKKVKFLYHASSLLSSSSVDCLRTNFLPLRTLKLTAHCNYRDKMIDEDDDAKRKRKKTVRPVEITLENMDGTSKIVPYNDAAKIAKRHNMFLIKRPHTDVKGNRYVYKIVDHATYISETNKDNQEGSEKEEKNKSNKCFTMSTKISKRDLDIKLNNINRSLDKKHTITIILNRYVENKEKLDVAAYIKKKIDGILKKEKENEHILVLSYSPSENKNDQKDDS